MHKCDQALIFGKETVGRIRSYLIFQKSILGGHLKFRIMAISLRTGTTRMMMRVMSPSTAGSKRLRIRIRAHRTNRHLLASKKRWFWAKKLVWTCRMSRLFRIKPRCKLFKWRRLRSPLSSSSQISGSTRPRRWPCRRIRSGCIIRRTRRTVEPTASTLHQVAVATSPTPKSRSSIIKLRRTEQLMANRRILRGSSWILTSSQLRGEWPPKLHQWR